MVTATGRQPIPFQPQGVLEVDGAFAAIQPVSTGVGTGPFPDGLPSPVPEPGVWTLMAIGLVGLVLLRRSFRPNSSIWLSAISFQPRLRRYRIEEAVTLGKFWGRFDIDR